MQIDTELVATFNYCFQFPSFEDTLLKTPMSQCKPLVSHPNVFYRVYVFSAGRRSGAFFGGVGGVLTGGNGAGFFFVLGMG